MALTPDEERKYREMFRKFDIDDDGCITIDELGQVFKDIGEDTNPVRLAKIIDEVDDDKSGTIEWNEFLTVIQKMRSGKTTQLGGVLSAREKILEQMKQPPPPQIAHAKKTWKSDSNKSTPEGKFIAGKGKLDPKLLPPKKSVTDLP